MSQGSGDWKYKIKVLTGLVSPETPLLDLQMAAFLLCPPTVLPLCELIPGVSLCVRISPYVSACEIGLGPP